MSKSKIEGRVSVTRDGPYVVTGNIPLAKQIIATNAKGESESWTQGHRFPSREKYSLCRCGQSSTKPFCDGTHAKIGFDGTETAERSRRQRYSTAQALLFLTREACAQMAGFVTRTGKCEIKSLAATIRIFGRCFYAKSIIVRRAVWKMMDLA